MRGKWLVFRDGYPHTFYRAGRQIAPYARMIAGEIDAGEIEFDKRRFAERSEAEARAAELNRAEAEDDPCLCDDCLCGDCRWRATQDCPDWPRAKSCFGCGNRPRGTRVRHFCDEYEGYKE